MVGGGYSSESSHSITWVRGSLVLLASLQILLSACSTVRQVDQVLPIQSATGDMAHVSEAVPEPEPEPEPEVNPYLVDREPIPERARRKFEQSKLAMVRGDWNSALLQLQGLVDEYPQLSGPSLNLALVYQQRDDKTHADHWFQQSIARNTNNLLAYNQYGIFLRERGRFEQAEKTYLAALAIWEPHADTHRNIGILYDLYRGDKKSAVQHFYRYQALQDKDDRVVAGWIVDLERQLNSEAERSSDE